MSVMKKKTDHIGPAGTLAIASGYTIKANPNPEKYWYKII